MLEKNQNFLKYNPLLIDWNNTKVFSKRKLLTVLSPYLKILLIAKEMLFQETDMLTQLLEEFSKILDQSQKEFSD
jgi:hypothetical protein